VFGRQSPYLQPGHFQVDLGYRALHSQWPNWERKHRERSVASFVINKQQIEDFVITYQGTKQTQVSLSIPVVAGSFSFLYGPIPVASQAVLNRPRTTEGARGIGDISLVARRWLLPTEHFYSGNMAFGLGCKFPTGKWTEQSPYPDINGKNLMMKAVDQSIQPGDGGFGMIADVQGFKQFRKVTLFGFGTYLVNPRNTNGTPSIITNLLGLQAAAKALPKEITNSVPDQYLAEVGFASPIPKVRGMYLSFASRIEGVPPTDLWGGNVGFRRAGFALYWEPGISYSHGNNVWSVNVPLLTFANLMQLPIDHRLSDATVANWIILARYSRRF
jgi:hypothetical protein